MTGRPFDNMGKRDIIVPPSTPTLTRSSSLIRRGLAAIQAKETRPLRFPTDLSLGQVYGRVPRENNDWQPFTWHTGWELLGEARGEFAVPRNLEVQLRIESHLHEVGYSQDDSFWHFTGQCDLSQLRMLEPDAIQSLILSPPDEQRIERYYEEVLKVRRSYSFDWICDTDLAHLSHLTGLRELAIFSDMVVENGLAHLWPLTNLRTLIIHSHRFSPHGVLYLHPLLQLRELDLGYYEAIRGWAVHLTNLPSLRALRFSAEETELAKPIVGEELQKLLKMALATDDALHDDL